jgi:hypothetical protein
MARIVITYPPDFDGELHIEVTDQKTGLSPKAWTNRTYTFTLATHTDTPWEDLVQVARDIIAQDSRRAQHPRSVEDMSG